MQDIDWFESWFGSPYYKILYQNRDELEAQEFVENLINYLQPLPKSEMLDIACGEGRFAVQLQEHGFEVTGIDLSHHSIEIAKKHENEHLQFFVHDMRFPFYINYFDYAFNFFTSFGYFRTRREHDNAIRTIAQSLKSGGIFVIDYLNVHYSEERLEKSFRTNIEGITFHITKWQDEEHFFKQIQVTDGAGTAPKHLYTERVAKFSLGDFTEMLAYQDMQVQEVFGDYKLGRYDVRKSPRMIIVAKKK